MNKRKSKNTQFSPVYSGIILSVLLVSMSCQEVQQLPEVPKPSHTWNVGFLVMQGVYNTELTAPMDIFHHTVFHAEPGMEVFTVAKTTDPIRTFEGLEFQPDYSYRTDSIPRIDVLVVPSAEHHLDTDLEDAEMIQFVKETGEQAKYVLSLCDGAFVLAINVLW